MNTATVIFLPGYVGIKKVKASPLFFMTSYIYFFKQKSGKFWDVWGNMHGLTNLKNLIIWIVLKLISQKIDIPISASPTPLKI